MNDDMFTAGTAIYSSDGKLRGVATGSQHRCRLAGCNGLRISVKWPDGKTTFPCSKDIIPKSKRWQIG